MLAPPVTVSVWPEPIIILPCKLGSTTMLPPSIKLIFPKLLLLFNVNLAVVFWPSEFMINSSASTLFSFIVVLT